MDQIFSLIDQYGYLIVFFGVMLESMGVPLPGETILIASGVLAQQGHLDVGDAIAFGMAGAVVGDQIGYWLGREGGRPFVLRWGRYVRITPERLERTERFFTRHGGKAIFLARFFAGFRVFGALVAGISRMHWGTFVLYNALGGAVWATAAVLVGYLFGGSLDLVDRWLGRATLVLAALVAVVVGFFLAYRWVANNRERLVGYGEAVISYPPVARLRTRYDSQLRWLLRRLAPGQYLGLHLTVGLAFAAGCLWLFGGLAEDLLTSDPIVRFDQATATYLHNIATPPLTAFFLTITALGSLETVALLTVLIAAVLARQRRWLYFWTWLTAVVGGVALNQALKHLFERPRPFFENPLLRETTYSFPSGHAMESFVLYGMLAYFAVLALRSWRARTAVVFGATLLVLLIGFSRMYLGVHYFSDVVAGYAAGGVWLSALITGVETIRRGDISVRPSQGLRGFLRSPVGLWLRRRLSPRGAYGLHLTVGLILIALFSWAFGGIVEDLLTKDPLAQVDVEILRYVHADPVPYLAPAATVLISIFSPEVLLPAGAVAGFALVVLARRRGDFRLGLYGAVLLAASFGAGALAELTKALFDRPRPPASLQLVPEAGNGFPSSHAIAAVVVGAVVWYVLILGPRQSRGGSWRAKALTGVAVILVALLVGVGRTYTGAHYPSDVLAGWALGGAWAAICLTAAEVIRRRHEGGSIGSAGSASTPGPDRPGPQRSDQEPSSRPWWRRTFEYKPEDRSTTPLSKGARRTSENALCTQFREQGTSAQQLGQRQLDLGSLLGQPRAELKPRGALQIGRI